MVQKGNGAMRSEAEIRRALAILMKSAGDAVQMGSNTVLIGSTCVGMLRFVLNDGESPWPKWLDDLEKS